MVISIKNNYFKLKIMIIILLSFLIVFLLGYKILYHDDFKEKLQAKTNITFEGMSAPRGRILDINGNVLVDNILINNLVFYNNQNVDISFVLDSLLFLFDNVTVTDKMLVNYYKAFNDYESLLTAEEKEKIEQRKISTEEKEEIIFTRIIKQVSFSSEDCTKAYIYDLLSSGYTYKPKIILKDISDEQIAQIIALNIPGIVIESSFERYYPYNDTLKSIFGKVGYITKETKDEYLQNGYSLTDEVGISYLEKYYDKYLKGTKAKYLVNDDGSLTLIKKEERGSDLYLSIDINLQLKVEEIIENELIKAKKYPNTEYLTDSYAIISNPKTGQINAIVGKRFLSNDFFSDITINNISSSFTMGSVVKGATISVGYKYDLIDPYEKIYDSCVKLRNLTQKCSHKELGYLDAITALKQSSNYYQFLIAISLAGQSYTYDMDLEVSQREFDIYRKMLASYGLGIKTGIDLPNEKIGLIGEKQTADLLLNLSIGQYDTYTPISLLTYINTLASYGKRRSPSLVTKIIDNKQNVIYENDFTVLENVDIESEDMLFIHQGFYEVMNNGTGRGFMNYNLSPAGKTGTSESFLDTNNDGLIDTKTLTLTMAGFFPYEDPSHSLIVICPHASHNNSSKEYIYFITSKISRQITDFMFENP